MSVYMKETEKPYGYILIDNQPKTTSEEKYESAQKRFSRKATLEHHQQHAYLSLPISRHLFARRYLRTIYSLKTIRHNLTKQMTGTWCTPELQKAVEKGYQVTKIHEVWHWPENQRKTGLFAPYVNTWLKHKTEASGWPSGVETEDQKATYMRGYEKQLIK